MMTVKEYDRHCGKLDWAEWLREVLSTALRGSGLRCEVDYLEAVWEDPSREEKAESPDVGPKLKTPEMYRLTIVRPLEWRVINSLAGEDISLEKALEITRAVMEFNSVAWPERISDDFQYGLFLQVPGFFDWLTEKTPEILYRLTMTQIEKHIGRKNIIGIDLYEDLLIVRTRRGDWRIDYDNFRTRITDVLNLMKPWMRKPIRDRFLYELRKNRNDKKKD